MTEELNDWILDESAASDVERMGPTFDEAALEFYQNCRYTLQQCINYMRMRRMGESAKMAEMLATGSFPATKTDKEFMKGSHEQFAAAPALGNRYRAIAEAHGVSTNGLFYCRGLARYPGDVQAWIAGRGDVVRLAQARGWGVSGAVEVERRQVEPMPDIEIGADIVAEMATDLVENGMDPHDATEYARAARSGKIDFYDVDEHVKPIPPEGLEYSPDF